MLPARARRALYAVLAFAATGAIIAATVPAIAGQREQHTWLKIAEGAVDPPIGPGLESVLAHNQDRRPEYFVIKGGALRHNWRQVSGAWYGWVSEGGSLVRMAVTNEADGRLRVYAIWTDGTLRTIAQNCANCGWGGWSGNLAPGVPLPNQPLVAGLDAAGRMQVFVVGADGRSVFQLSESAPNGDLSSPRQVSTLPVAVSTSELRATFAHNADGRPEIYFPLSDGGTWQNWQWGDGTWSVWYPLGNARNSAVHVVNEADGRLAVYSAGTAAWGDNALHRMAQSCPNCGWGGWTTVGGAIGADRDVTDLAVAPNKDGRLEAFAFGDAPGSTDVGHQPPYTLHHIVQNAPNGPWGDWTDFGPLPDGYTYWPMGLQMGFGSAAGQLWVFAPGSDGANVYIWSAWQPDPGGPWL